MSPIRAAVRSVSVKVEVAVPPLDPHPSTAKSKIRARHDLLLLDRVLAIELHCDKAMTQDADMSPSYRFDLDVRMTEGRTKASCSEIGVIHHPVGQPSIARGYCLFDSTRQDDAPWELGPNFSGATVDCKGTGASSDAHAGQVERNFGTDHGLRT